MWRTRAFGLRRTACAHVRLAFTSVFAALVVVLLLKAPRSDVSESHCSPQAPVVFATILARTKAQMLPVWLAKFDAYTYPKKRMVVYIRANDCIDTTVEILQEWAQRHRHEYLSVIEDYSSVMPSAAAYGVHEWNAVRFAVLGAIREKSIALAIQNNVGFYFVCDVDNMLLPHTLSTLVRHNLPIVAPMLHYALEEDEGKRGQYGSTYSNFHNVADKNGYFQPNEDYDRIHSRSVRGLLQCDVVHCTYLIRADVLSQMRYIDGSERYEYVVFSDNARKRGIPQYLDNQEVYGYLSLSEDVGALKRSMGALTLARGNDGADKVAPFE